MGDPPGATPAAGRPASRSEWIGPAPCSVERLTHHPFHDLRALLRATDGLWVGLLSYDLGRWVERLPATAVDDRDWPLIELGYCPGYLLHDGETGAWYACGAWARGGYPELPQAQPLNIPFTASSLGSNFTRPAYEAAVATAQRYIAAGDAYQVNLAQRFTAQFETGHPGPGASRCLYQRLAGLSPAWYGAYLELAPRVDPASDIASGAQTLIRAVASVSPELFLELRDGAVTTRPIKGTRPASVAPDELRDSAKDLAELNMIVDLLRNDLGRVCSYGSIRVSDPRTIETHPSVHHGVATIEGRLHESKDLVDLLRATMPGGSVTGAPKVRAMQLIEQLEPVRRGPYCGCIGWLSRHHACLNVAIRTMLIDPERSRVDFSVGAGIVADSHPAQEYEETLAKARVMLQALSAAEIAAASPHASFSPKVTRAASSPSEATAAQLSS